MYAIVKANREQINTAIMQEEDMLFLLYVSTIQMSSFSPWARD